MIETMTLHQASKYLRDKGLSLCSDTLADGLELGEAHRYRVRTLPAAGAILRADDSAEQLTL